MTQLLITQSAPTSCYLVPLRPLGTLFSNVHSLYFSLSVKSQIKGLIKFQLHVLWER